MERKMASVQVINGVYPIDGADKICQYGINGWKVVDQVGKYQVGDLVVFCEVDSWIPTKIAPFLTKPGHFPKVYNEVNGEKLRTIRLRKALSQGLILPFSILNVTADGVEYEALLEVGDDASEILGIQKWEPPPEFSSGDCKGNFPAFIYKTDQERIQNCFRDMEKLFDSVKFEVTEKLEGSSITIYHKDGEVGVCSRNLELKEDEANTFWKTALAEGIVPILKDYGANIAIQGELVGAGIQGNIYGLNEHRIYVYDIFDIDNQKYLEPDLVRVLCVRLNLRHVPVINPWHVLTGTTMDLLLDAADGYSVLNGKVRREGLVYKADSNERISFKTISNLYLEKQKDPYELSIVD